MTNDTLYNLINQYDVKAAIDRCKSHPEECSYVFKSEKEDKVRFWMLLEHLDDVLIEIIYFICSFLEGIFESDMFASFIGETSVEA